MSVMNIKAILLVVFLAVYGGGAFWLGGEHTRKVAAQDKLDSVIYFLDDAQKRQEKLQRTLDNLPKSEGTIREIVRQNPAPCVMPKPVADGLHEAVDKANAARKMP